MFTFREGGGGGGGGVGVVISLFGETMRRLVRINWGGAPCQTNPALAFGKKSLGS